MKEFSLKEKTAKGLFWGGLNNSIQQFLGLVFGIFLARMLNAEDYGLIGMLSIFTGIATSIINSGFTVALINRKEIIHKELNAVFWFTVFMSVCLYIILYCTAPLISRFYERSELISLSRFLFISFFFSGIANVSYAVMMKKLMVKQQALIEISAVFIAGFLGIILAIKGYSYWALAIQSVIFISLSAILRIVVAPWKPTFNFNFSPLKKMFSFSVNIFLTNIFLQINNNLLSVVLGKIYNAQQVGYFTQANKWMNMGNQVVTGMINSVAQPILVQVNENKERQKNIIRKIIRFIAFISFPAFLGLAFIAKEFIYVTIGQKWAHSIILLQILCLWGLISPLINLYIQLIISHGKSKVYLKLTVLTGIFQLMAIILFAQFGIIYMVSSYVLIYFINFLGWHYYVNKLIGLELKEVGKDIFPYFLITLFALGASWLLTLRIENLYLLLISKTFITAIIYICILWKSNSIIFRESISLFKNKILH